MDWWQDRDHYKLSTGRTFYANCGIIGLRPRDETADFEFEKKWYVFYGRDGGVDLEAWTKEEKEELADFMIDLWDEFKREVDEKAKQQKN